MFSAPTAKLAFKAWPHELIGTMPQNPPHPVWKYRPFQVAVGRRTSNWICGAIYPVTSQYAGVPADAATVLAEVMLVGASRSVVKSWVASDAQSTTGVTVAACAVRWVWPAPAAEPCAWATEALTPTRAATVAATRPRPISRL